MKRTTSSLDFLGVLWYHMRVKLGCYATASHRFDSVFCALMAGKPRGRNRVAVPGFSFPWRRKQKEFCLSCPICVSLFSAERASRCGHAYLCVMRSACARLPRWPMPADAQERNGAVLPHHGMLTAASCPPWPTVFPEPPVENPHRRKV